MRALLASHEEFAEEIVSRVRRDAAPKSISIVVTPKPKVKRTVVQSRMRFTGVVSLGRATNLLFSIIGQILAGFSSIGPCNRKFNFGIGCNAQAHCKLWHPGYA